MLLMLRRLQLGKIDCIYQRWELETFLHLNKHGSGTPKPTVILILKLPPCNIYPPTQTCNKWCESQSLVADAWVFSISLLPAAHYARLIVPFSRAMLIIPSVVRNYQLARNFKCAVVAHTSSAAQPIRRSNHWFLLPSILLYFRRPYSGIIALGPRL